MYACASQPSLPLSLSRRMRSNPARDRQKENAEHGAHRRGKSVFPDLGRSFVAHVEPLRLVLLAEEPEWAALLRARLRDPRRRLSADHRAELGGGQQPVRRWRARPAADHARLPAGARRARRRPSAARRTEPVVEPAVSAIGWCATTWASTCCAAAFTLCRRARLLATLQRLAEQDPRPVSPTARASDPTGRAPGPSTRTRPDPRPPRSG